MVALIWNLKAVVPSVICKLVYFRSFRSKMSARYHLTPAKHLLESRWLLYSPFAAPRCFMTVLQRSSLSSPPSPNASTTASTVQREAKMVEQVAETSLVFSGTFSPGLLLPVFIISAGKSSRSPPILDRVLTKPYSFFDFTVLSAQKVLSRSGRAGRLRLRAKYIDHRLHARSDLDNTFWADSSLKGFFPCYDNWQSNGTRFIIATRIYGLLLLVTFDFSQMGRETNSSSVIINEQKSFPLHRSLYFEVFIHPSFVWDHWICQPRWVDFIITSGRISVTNASWIDIAGAIYFSSRC